MSLGRKLQILYVAPHYDDVELMEVAIRPSNVEILRAESVASALKLLTAQRFDVCVMETRFPDGNGFDLCSFVTRYQPGISTIFYTGDAGKAYRERGFCAGADHYLTKPYFDLFIETILDVLTQLDPGSCGPRLQARAA